MGIIVCPIKVSTVFFKNNCYLLIDENTKEAIAIDPVWDLKKVENQLNSYQAKLISIFLTHSHPDHTHLADKLAKKHYCQVFMSRNEAEFYHFNCQNLELFSSEDTLKSGHFSIIPIITPGHTKGSTCFLIENNLFTGDTLFIEGCGMCVDAGSDIVDLYKSINRLKETIRPDTRVFPGHCYGILPGKPFSFLLENNIYLQLNDYKQFVTLRMRKNQDKLFAFK